VIPTSRLDPIAMKLMPYWPEPNAAGTRDGLNNYVLAPSALENCWDHLGRLDHAFSEKHRAYVSFHTSFWQEEKNHYFPTPNPASGIIVNRHIHGASLDDVYVFDPTFLFNVRYGVTFGDFIERRYGQGFDVASLGFSPQLMSLVLKDRITFPSVSVGSFRTLGDWQNGDGGTYSLTHSLNGSFTRLAGNHTLRFGADFRVPAEL
jgi:hypothetical protein